MSLENRFFKIRSSLNPIPKIIVFLSNCKQTYEARIQVLSIIFVGVFVQINGPNINYNIHTIGLNEYC